MSGDEPQPQGFLDAVSKWLQANGHDGAVAKSVHSYGTDWAGDTEPGFYSKFDVTVSFEYPGGLRGAVSVEGEAMNGLWDAVVRGYTAN